MQDTNRKTSDNEGYETVIYKGPDHTCEPVHNPKPQQNVKLQPMDIRLAQIPAQCSDLFSPDFFRNKLESSSSDSTRDGTAEITSSLHSPPNIFASSLQNVKKPFTFSKVTINKGEDGNNNSPIHDIAMNIERVEILEDDSEEYNEDEWVEWPKYVEQNGFLLGIQPGDFYKNKYRPCFYVKIPHRSKYEVLVTNNNQVPCDLDLYMNGQLTNCLRLPAGTSKSVDGPANSKYAFKLFRSSDVPSDKKVKEGIRENGIVKAVFTPQKVDNSRLRSASEPFRIGKIWNEFNDILGRSSDEKKPRSFTSVLGEHDIVERSLDMAQVAEGVILLQGRKKKKQFMTAPEMEVDKSQRVILKLRLIASLTEEVEATEDEIYDIEPPPLPS